MILVAPLRVAADFSQQLSVISVGGHATMHHVIELLKL